ncbi:MAG: hypothetical protein QOE26_891 [Verrucomicrobiota bacterium]|jgi:hypothetical protein
MKQEFLKPRFAGPRFDQHTLPVEVARDLAAYEELVVELAKHLYLADHPKRKRVPKGFEQSFSLHLEQVEGGSARPLLSWVTAVGMLALQGIDGYFEQSRNLVAECVAASEAGAPLPEQFPKQLLDYFNVFGRSLHEGESVDVAPAGAGAAVLTPERRKALVLAAQKVYTKEVDLSGTVGETDWEKGTFRLRLEDGSAIVAPLPEAFCELARAAGGKERILTQVKGIGVFDAWDKMQKLAETHHMDMLPNYQLSAQIEKLLTLEDGWYEGGGKALEKEQLGWVADALVSTFPDDLAFPHVAATPDGGLFLEWVAGSWRLSAEFSLADHVGEMHALNTATGESAESDINIESEDDWAAFYAFVRRFV